MKRPAHTTRPGFTLIEMLVVIAIISIVLAISFPMIGAMQRDTNASSAVNTISVAIPTARRYATDKISFFDVDLSTTEVEQGLYSGAAALFTPAGEVRFIKNQESAEARYRGGYLERYTQGYATQGAGLPKRELNGFEDIDIDYLILPEDAGVAGINRVSGGASNGLFVNDADSPPLLLPPPFAVWYNQSGYLVTTGVDLIAGTHNHYQYVYYDGDYDGYFVVDESRPRSTRHNEYPYDPDVYNPNSGLFASATGWDSSEKKYILPFEAIEAVVGIYVYSRADFQEANDKWADGVIDPEYAAPPWTDTSLKNNKDRWEWMKLHGELLMFSKQSGALMRNRDE